MAVETWGRDLAEVYDAVTACVRGLDEEGLGAPTRTEWTVTELLFHLLLDAQRALVTLATPADEPPDTDAVDAGYSPPDRPYALDDDELTVAGQRDGETLDERLARELPEEVPVDADRAGRLADPEQHGLMERGDAIEGQDVGVDGGAASAEEAAMHVVDLGADPDALADDEGGGAAVDDQVVAETLAGDPTADAARVDAARDARATDEGSA